MKTVEAPKMSRAELEREHQRIGLPGTAVLESEAAPAPHEPTRSAFRRLLEALGAASAGRKAAARWVHS
jgi:hypothetical protein